MSSRKTSRAQRSVRISAALAMGRYWPYFFMSFSVPRFHAAFNYEFRTCEKPCSALAWHQRSVRDGKYQVSTSIQRGTA